MALLDFHEDQRGFTLIEMVITAALFAVVALAASTLTTNMGRAVNLAASQASTIALASGLRAQIARRATCAGSLAAPANVAAGGELGITLSGGPVVRAGSDLSDCSRTCVRSSSRRVAFL